MKKKLFLSGAIITASLLLVPSFKEVLTQEADAAFVSSKILEEDFSGSEISSKWSIYNDASLEKKYSSFRLTPFTYDWTAAVTLNKELKGTYTIKMDVQSLKHGGWLGIGLGNISNSSQFYNAKGGFFFFDDNYSQKMEVVDGVLTHTGDYYASCFGTNDREKRHLEIYVKQVGNKQTLQASIFTMSGALIGNVFSTPAFYDNLDGYLSLNDSLKDLEIFNVEITNAADETIYYDDFSTSSVLYPTSGVSSSMWRSTYFDENELKVGFVNELSLPVIDSGIIYNDALEKIDNDELDIVYTIRSTVDISSMDLNTETGIQVGMDDAGRGGTFFGVRRKATNYELVSYNVTSNNEVTAQSTTIPSDMLIDLTLNIHKSGLMELTSQDIELSQGNVTYEGYFGLFTRGLHATSTDLKGGRISFVLLTRELYKNRSEPDVYNNFDGTRKEWFEVIGTYVYSYYLSRREWNVGSNVRTIDYKEEDEGNGRLEFYQAYGSSFFAPRNTYKDFIIRFDVNITTSVVPYGGTVGISFGASRTGLALENVQALGIGYYRDGTDQSKYVNTIATSNVDFTEDSPQGLEGSDGQAPNFFQNYGKFTLMYICRNNEVSMHYVLENEDIHNLSKVRAKVKTRGFSTTDGFVSVFGANGLSFDIDNYSLINLDYEAPAAPYLGESDYQETTRLDFTNSNDVRGIDLFGAKIERKSLVIEEGGSVYTNRLANDGILRFETKNIEDTLNVDFTNFSIDFVNHDDEKKMVVWTGSSNQVITLDNEFDFSGATFDITKLGDKLTLRYVGGNEKFSHIDENIVTLNVPASRKYDFIEMSTLNGFASLNNLSFFNLDKNITIKARDYDPEKDNFNPWPEKPVKGNGGSSNGCAGDASMQSLLIAFVSFTGIVTVISLKKRKESK